ncbi:MAG: hypothetical protein AB1505_06075 [Candidatus Latescibacterota bacterium]
MIRLGMMVRQTPAQPVTASVELARKLELDAVDIHLSSLPRDPGYLDNGTEEWLDYPRILRILRAAGFNGTIGLVFELGERNQRPCEECVRLAVRHLRQVIAATSP